MPKIKAEDVDYVHIEEVTFSVVMRDGSDVLVSEKGIELDTYTKEQLADNVMYHIEKGKPVEILDDDDDLITFESDVDLNEAD